MVVGDGGHGSLDRNDLVGRLLGVAADVEADERCAPVLRVLRRLDVGDGGEATDVLAHVTGHGVQVGSGQPAAARLDEDHLAGRCLGRREGLVEHLRRAAGLADALLGLLERLLGHKGCTDEEADDNERHPAENRRPRMRAAPATHPVSEVALGLHCDSPPQGSYGVTCVDRPSVSPGRSRMRAAALCLRSAESLPGTTARHRPGGE